MQQAVAKLWPEIEWIDDKEAPRPGRPDLGESVGAQPAEAGTT